MNSPRPNRAFTLIEMMVVITLIGIVSTTVAIRIDMFGTDRGNELERLLTFVRSQHARAFQESRIILLKFDEREETATARTPDGKILETLTVSRWSIKTSSSSPLRLTPWGVQGKAIKLESEDRTITLVPNPTLTLVEQS